MITITRTERTMITGAPQHIDAQEFPDADHAKRWLRVQEPRLTEAQLDEICTSPLTHFERLEMINRGTSAYSGTVVYEIRTTWRCERPAEE